MKLQSRCKLDKHLMFEYGDDGLSNLFT